MSIRATFLFAALLLLVACRAQEPSSAATDARVDAAPVPAAAPAKADDSARLARILDLSNIDRRIDIFERVAGPPVDAGKDWASYAIDGCQFNVDLDGQVIRLITLELAPGCGADLRTLVGNDKPLRADAPLTFAGFEARFGKARFEAPCLGRTCGNAFEPYVEAVVDGVHVTNFIDFVATARVIEANATPIGAWESTLAAATAENPGFLDDLRFNCDRRHDDLGRKALADAQVHSVSFGRRGDVYGCHRAAP